MEGITVNSEEYVGSQSELPFIAICMPVYNSGWSLKSVLEAICDLDYPKKLLRLVFVDSYSTDGTYESLLNFKKKYGIEYENIVVERINQRGLTLARNTCVKHAKGFIFWLDSDVIVPPNILKVLLSHFWQRKKLGWASAAYHHTNPNLSERLFIAREPRPHGNVDFAEIGAALVRPEVWRGVGPFNEGLGHPYPCVWDTTDYCARIRKAGWKILLDTSVRCFHLSSANVRDKIGLGEGVASLRAQVKSMITVSALKHYGKYYFNTVPVGVHQIIKVGDFKYLVRMIYYFLFPYVVFTTLLIQQQLFVLYLLPTLVYYTVKTKGWTMKVLVCIFVIPAKIIIAQGYAWMLIKRFFGRLSCDTERE